MLKTPAAVKNNHEPTNFYEPGFTNYYAYKYLLFIFDFNIEDFIPVILNAEDNDFLISIFSLLYYFDIIDK